MGVPNGINCIDDDGGVDCMEMGVGRLRSTIPTGGDSSEVPVPAGERCTGVPAAEDVSGPPIPIPGVSGDAVRCVRYMW